MPLAEVKSKSHHLRICDLTLVLQIHEAGMYLASPLSAPSISPSLSCKFLLSSLFIAGSFLSILLLHWLLSDLWSSCWSISEVSSEELQTVLILVYSCFTWFSSEYHVIALFFSLLISPQLFIHSLKIASFFNMLDIASYLAIFCRESCCSFGTSSSQFWKPKMTSWNLF